MAIETMPGATVEPSVTPAPVPSPAVEGSPAASAGTALPDATSAAPAEADRSRAIPLSPERQAALARAIVRTLARALPPESPVTVGLAGDGGDPDPDALAGRAHLRVRGPGALARMLPPTENAFADAFLRGDIDIDGDIALAVATARDLDFRRLSAEDMRRVARWSLELRRADAAGPAAAPSRPPARLHGPRHSRARDLEAIRFHYDVGETFFGLWLDHRLTYSCAYFERDDDPARDLDAAQEAKLDLVCRKLDLRPGQRMLDIGCGWGSLILHAAQYYGVEAVGVTLSQRQADEANRRAASKGLEGLVRAEVRDYRDLAPLGWFEAVASIGMFEHVGAAMLPVYFGAAFDALAPGGRFLNHGIATAERTGAAGPLAGRWRGGLRRATFTERYVFPDGELVPVEEAARVARDVTGFELLDVQSLRPHYALTLRAWVERLEAAWDQAVEAAGEEVARTWRLYMAGSRVGFERGELDVAQLLLARPLGAHAPAPRPLRPWW